MVSSCFRYPRKYRTINDYKRKPTSYYIIIKPKTCKTARF